MKKAKVKAIVRIILLVLLLFFTAYMSLIAEFPYGKVSGIAILIWSVLLFVPFPKLKMERFLHFGLLVAFIFVVLYDISTAKMFILINHVTYRLRNTQACYYNEVNRYHKDVLIYTLMSDKTAIVQSESVWYYKFFQMFSANIECNPGEIYEIDSFNTDDYVNVGIMRMQNCEDLIPKNVCQELSRRLSDGVYYNLYISFDGWYFADKILVTSDEDYNIYLKPCEEHR